MQGSKHVATRRRTTVIELETVEPFEIWVARCRCHLGGVLGGHFLQGSISIERGLRKKQLARRWG